MENPNRGRGYKTASSNTPSTHSTQHSLSMPHPKRRAKLGAGLSPCFPSSRLDPEVSTSHITATAHHKTDGECKGEPVTDWGTDITPSFSNLNQIVSRARPNSGGKPPSERCDGRQVGSAAIEDARSRTGSTRASNRERKVNRSGSDHLQDSRENIRRFKGNKLCIKENKEDRRTVAHNPKHKLQPRQQNEPDSKLVRTEKLGKNSTINDLPQALLKHHSSTSKSQHRLSNSKSSLGKRHKGSKSIFASESAKRSSDHAAVILHPQPPAFAKPESKTLHQFNTLPKHESVIDGQPQPPSLPSMSQTIEDAADDTSPASLDSIKCRYLGVTFRSRRNKYQARMYRGSREYNLGLFDLAADAALAYDTAHRVAGGRENSTSNFNNDNGDNGGEEMFAGVEEIKYALDWLDCAEPDPSLASRPSNLSKDDPQHLNFLRPSEFRIARQKEVADYIMGKGPHGGKRATEFDASTIPTESELKLRIKKEILTLAKAYVAQHAQRFPTQATPGQLLSQSSVSQPVAPTLSAPAAVPSSESVVDDKKHQHPHNQQDSSHVASPNVDSNEIGDGETDLSRKRPAPKTPQNIRHHQHPGKKRKAWRPEHRKGSGDERAVPKEDTNEHALSNGEVQGKGDIRSPSEWKSSASLEGFQTIESSNSQKDKRADLDGPCPVAVRSNSNYMAAQRRSKLNSPSWDAGIPLDNYQADHKNNDQNSRFSSNGDCHEQDDQDARQEQAQALLALTQKHVNETKKAALAHKLSVIMNGGALQDRDIKNMVPLAPANPANPAGNSSAGPIVSSPTENFLVSSLRAAHPSGSTRSKGENLANSCSPSILDIKLHGNTNPEHASEGDLFRSVDRKPSSTVDSKGQIIDDEHNSTSSVMDNGRLANHTPEHFVSANDSSIQHRCRQSLQEPSLGQDGNISTTQSVKSPAVVSTSSTGNHDGNSNVFGAGSVDPFAPNMTNLLNMPNLPKNISLDQLHLLAAERFGLGVESSSGQSSQEGERKVTQTQLQTTMAAARHLDSSSAQSSSNETQLSRPSQQERSQLRLRLPLNYTEKKDDQAKDSNNDQNADLKENGQNLEARNSSSRPSAEHCTNGQNNHSSAASLATIMTMGGLGGLSIPIPTAKAGVSPKRLKVLATEQGEQRPLERPDIKLQNCNGAQEQNNLQMLLQKQLMNEAKKAALAQKLSVVMGGGSVESNVPHDRKGNLGHFGCPSLLPGRHIPPIQGSGISSHPPTPENKSTRHSNQSEYAHLQQERRHHQLGSLPHTHDIQQQYHTPSLLSRKSKSPIPPLSIASSSLGMNFNDANETKDVSDVQFNKERVDREMICDDNACRELVGQDHLEQESVARKSAERECKDHEQAETGRIDGENVGRGRVERERADRELVSEQDQFTIQHIKKCDKHILERSLAERDHERVEEHQDRNGRADIGQMVKQSDQVKRTGTSRSVSERSSIDHTENKSAGRKPYIGEESHVTPNNRNQPGFVARSADTLLRKQSIESEEKRNYETRLGQHNGSMGQNRQDCQHFPQQQTSAHQQQTQFKQKPASPVGRASSRNGSSPASSGLAGTAAASSLSSSSPALLGMQDPHNLHGFSGVSMHFPEHLDEHMLRNLIMKKQAEENNKVALEKKLRELIGSQRVTNPQTSTREPNPNISNILQGLRGSSGNVAALISQRFQQMEDQTVSSPLLQNLGCGHNRGMLQSLIQEGSVQRPDRLDPLQQAIVQSLLVSQQNEGQSSSPLQAPNSQAGVVNTPHVSSNSMPSASRTQSHNISGSQPPLGNTISDAVTFDVVNRRLAIETMLMSEESRLRQLREALQSQFVSQPQFNTNGPNLSFSHQDLFLERDRALINEELRKALLAEKLLHGNVESSNVFGGEMGNEGHEAQPNSLSSLQTSQAVALQQALALQASQGASGVAPNPAIFQQLLAGNSAGGWANNINSYNPCNHGSSGLTVPLNQPLGQSDNLNALAQLLGMSSSSSGGSLPLAEIARQSNESIDPENIGSSGIFPRPTNNGNFS